MTGLDGGPVDFGSDDLLVPSLPGYQIIAQLGRGGMGSVWRARQTSTQRDVALKLISGQAFQNDRIRARFAREIELAARLEHPHIARVYDSGVDRGVYYYSMQLIEGEHLDHHVRSRHLSTEERLKLFLQVCDAVAFAHRRGIIHRDLKPSNVVVDGRGLPHLVDFGLARAAEVTGDIPAISLDGEMAGTLEYMAPEQAAGDIAAIDAQCDVYALGVILHELLTGQLPHPREGSVYERRKRLIEQEPRRATALASGIDADLEAVLAKGVARDRQGRYRTVEELADDIRSYLSGEPVSARRLTLGYFLTKWAARHRLRLGVGAAASALVLVGAIYAYGMWTAAKSRADTEARHARHSLYVNQIMSARRALAEGDAAEVRRILMQTPPAERRWEWRWLLHASDSSVRTFQSPAGDRVAVAWFADNGMRLSALTHSGQILAWDARNGEPLGSAHRDVGDALAFSAATHAPVVVGSPSDGQLTAWNYASDTTVHIEHAAIRRAFKVHVSPSGRHAAWCTRQGVLHVWHIDKGRVEAWPQAPGIFAMAVSSTATAVVTCDDDRCYLSYWTDGRLTSHTLDCDGTVAQAAFSIDGQRLATCTREGRIQIWSLAVTPPQLSQSIAGLDSVRCMTFGHNGRLLAAASGDASIGVWDTHDGEQVALWCGHAADPTLLRFSTTGNEALSVDEAGTVKTWRLEQSSIPQRIRVGDGATTLALAAAKRTGHVIVGCADGSVRVIAPRVRAATTLDGRHRGDVSSVDCDANASIIVSSSFDGTVLLHEPVTPSKARTIVDYGDRQVTRVGLDAEGRLIAVKSTRGVEVYRVIEPGRILEVEHARAFAWARSGGTLWTATRAHRDSEVALQRWSADGDHVEPKGRFEFPSLQSIAASPDGRHIALVSTKGIVKIWDSEHRRVAMTFNAHRGFAGWAAFEYNQDGSRLLTSGMATRLWDTTTGLALLELPNPNRRDRVSHARFDHHDDGVWATQRDAVLRWLPNAHR